MAKKKKEPNTIFFNRWLYDFENLSLDEVGRITIALLRFSEFGEITEFDDRALDVLFKQYSRAVADNRESYKATCEKNAENARKAIEKKVKEKADERAKEIVACATGRTSTPPKQSFDFDYDGGDFTGEFDDLLEHITM